MNELTDKYIHFGVVFDILYILGIFWSFIEICWVLFFLFFTHHQDIFISFPRIDR